ncbi:DUF2867 domain-containing protein [Kribbella sp. NPDC003505]|uniref:DUF2867 domain-containing protein n=1 Tax=Kribbella sp. NPDC003505 TaxID=3154448 RepID=UPI0033A1F9BD
MRVAHGEHISRPWRIHEIAHDFDIEDVWALPVRGGPDDLGLLIAGMANARRTDESSIVVKFIWAFRWKLGAWLGWDGPDEGTGSRVLSLCDRVAVDLRDETAGPITPNSPFAVLYQTRNEYAAEIANRTMHGVLHLGWIDDGNGAYRGQMAVLVKTNGCWGKAYMALIKPFRYLVIYPALMRQIEREWARARRRSTEDTQ